MAPTATTLMIGTTKGAFLAISKDRKNWTLSGPHCDFWPINHMTCDPKTNTIWAGGGGTDYGAGIWCSTDGGATWDVTRLTTGTMDEWAANDPEFAKLINWTDEPLPFGDDFMQIWSLGYSNGTLYAGTKPAQLLQSTDRGKTWTKNEALASFEGRDSWAPGAAGLTLHTIVKDPQNPDKLWLGISAAGVFATEDGGQSWERRNRVSNAEVCEGHSHPAAPANSEIGHCVHNMMRAQGETDLLYQQNHHGVWRSQDGGRSWDDVSDGLPSTFGFPLRIHPHDPNTIWTIPLNGDGIGRFPPDAAAAVWRSRDGGETWEATRNGLPQENCYFTVLRQAMAGDNLSEPGLYFGTNTGSIFASLDEGDSWAEIATHLPTILSVEVQDTA